MDGSRRYWGILTLQALDTIAIQSSHIKGVRQNFPLVGGMGSQRKQCLKVESTTTQSRGAKGRFAGVLLVKWCICRKSWKVPIRWRMPPKHTILVEGIGGVQHQDGPKSNPCLGWCTSISVDALWTPQYEVTSRNDIGCHKTASCRLALQILLKGSRQRWIWPGNCTCGSFKPVRSSCPWPPSTNKQGIYGENGTCKQENRSQGVFITAALQGGCRV